MVERIPCQTCGTMFTPRRSGGKPQVRCSEKCRRKVANANFIKKNAPVRTTACAECGGPVEQAVLGRPRRYCSDECKARVGNRAARRRQLPIRDPNPAERSCAHCGVPFTPRRRDQVYCSNSSPPYCAVEAYKKRRAAGEPLRQVEQTRTCVECGENFTAHKSNAKWCSKICRIRTTGRDASRRRRPVRPEWKPYADREIFERDGWICQICHRPIDRNVSRTHVDGATIDHVVPLSRGGADEPANVVTAHWSCNRDKGNRQRSEHGRSEDDHVREAGGGQAGGEGRPAGARQRGERSGGASRHGGAGCRVDEPCRAGRRGGGRQGRRRAGRGGAQGSGRSRLRVTDALA